MSRPDLHDWHSAIEYEHGEYVKHEQLFRRAEKKWHGEVERWAALSLYFSIVGVCVHPIGFAFGAASLAGTWWACATREWAVGIADHAARQKRIAAGWIEMRIQTWELAIAIRDESAFVFPWEVTK